MAKGWWRLAAIGYAVFLFIVSVIPVSGAPRVPYLDKVVHLCEYWLFAWILTRGRSRTRTSRWNIWGIATLYGVLIEGIQACIPWRSAELMDAASNAVGALIGVFWPW